MNTCRPRIAIMLLAVVIAAGCSPAPPASAPPAGVVAGRELPRYTEADVRFLQGMIPHHAQALEMTALAPTRAGSEAIRRLAERIEVSQQDEIATMQRWLRERGEEVPGAHAHHGAGAHARMPGMLTPEQLARLAAASGAEFDRLFLESMIQHHEGALVMVADLFGSEGGGQESEIFAIASEVDADQRMEIERMRRLLATLPSAAHPR